ncbi:uncharacterized protein [Hoplias malabaricus]|uniref:uncharacterized protein isoform X2 n=1 Tax=Hoplias malabaricus TaxID=27720 RepID=UPI003461C43C
MQGVSGVGSVQFGHEAERSECLHTGAAESYGYQMNMKTEPHMFTINSTEELQFLRTRVQVLEREKAEMAAENQRLKDLLVKEIPHLLSTMWQTISNNAGQSSVSQPGPVLSESVTAGVNSYMPVPYKEQDCDLPPAVSAAIKSVQQDMILETGSYGHKMADSHNEVDGVMFEAMEEMNGNLCPVVLREDGNMYLSSPCSSTDSASSFSENRTVNQNSTPVEVYPGSGVFCAEHAWLAANMARSPTAMVRALLLGVFDMDTLLNSNLRGGRSRRPSYSDHHAPLDPEKLNAIYNATLARFPLARKGQIGTGINSKLSEIRFRSRKVKRDRRGR